MLATAPRDHRPQHGRPRTLLERKGQVMPTIVIADDELAIRQLVRVTLASAERLVLEAKNGEEAWELIQRHRPAVVLLDIRMPGRTGLELAHAIKTDPALAHAYVILLTGSTREQDHAAARAAGADMYLTRPFSPLQLLTVVDQVLAQASPPDDPVPRVQLAPAHYRALVEASADAVFVADEHGRYVAVNRAATELLGYTRTELLRLQVSDVAAGGTHRANGEFAWLKATGAWQGELDLTRKDGQRVRVELRATTTEVRRTPLYVGVARDVSQRQAQEQTAARLTAQRLHELNNDLTLPLARLDLLQRDPTLPAAVRPSINQALAFLERMQHHLAQWQQLLQSETQQSPASPSSPASGDGSPPGTA
jgi:two-component system, OmpR family, phosphate regulon response regulator PhoB